MSASVVDVAAESYRLNKSHHHGVLPALYNFRKLQLMNCQLRINPAAPPAESDIPDKALKVL